MDIRISWRDRLGWKDLNQLPNEPGIYLWLYPAGTGSSKDYAVVYVGQASDIRKRMPDHLRDTIGAGGTIFAHRHPYEVLMTLGRSGTTSTNLKETGYYGAKVPMTDKDVEEIIARGPDIQQYFRVLEILCGVIATEEQQPEVFPSGSKEQTSIREQIECGIIRCILQERVLRNIDKTIPDLCAALGAKANNTPIGKMQTRPKRVYRFIHTGLEPAWLQRLGIPGEIPEEK